MECVVNLKKITLGLVLCSAFISDANATKNFEEKYKENPFKSRTPSTYSATSQMTAYEDLSVEGKYKANLRSFKQDKKISLLRMEELAKIDNYEEAQLYLAECYRTGVLGKSDKIKAIEFNEMALKTNNSFRAASSLAGIYWASGDFEQAKEYCENAKILGNQSNQNLEFINILLRKMNEE